jgi:hypothetical protein
MVEKEYTDFMKIFNLYDIPVSGMTKRNLPVKSLKGAVK